MESRRHIIVGTAGHIDHGKSALVEALTGTHPDRLEEEKRRGITLDLGFAFLESDGVRFGFVDVPGHERFVRNMLAGAGGFDLVLLVIAADESIKPQTREHFDICRLLHIPRGIVALTKSDLVDAETLGLVRLEVEEFLRGSFLEGAPIVPVSAKTGAGLAALKQELVRVAGDVPRREASRYTRLPIDRAFVMKGFGTVVTGTLVSGTIRPDDEVEVFPARRRVRVRGVHSGGEAVAYAAAGQRTAVNLAGIDIAEVSRGMTLASPERFEHTTRADARVTLLDSARRLKHRARVHFHQGTAETIAEILLLESNEIQPGKSALAQLRFAEPLLLLPGDRFILRQFSPVVTLGGGIVLDAHPARVRPRDTRRLPLLAAFEHGSREEILGAMVEAAPDGIEMPHIIARTGWLEPEVLASAGKLAETAKVRVISREPLLLAGASAFAKLTAEIRAGIERFHRENPLSPGIAKEELRAKAAPRIRNDVFSAALADLEAARAIRMTGDLIAIAGREIALQPEEARAKEQIEEAFAKAGLAVPALDETLGKLPVERRRAQKLLQMSLREGTLVKVSEDMVFHRAALARLRDLLAKYKNEKGASLPIAAFKEMTGATRKYAIPLLEYLDRERVTRRAGDERVIL